MSFLDPYYLWFKVFHLFSIIAWMAGLFYFPRLLAYHATVPWDSDRALLLQTMEKRLMSIIMVPSMILSLLSGATLVIVLGVACLKSGWFHLKILNISVLLFFHYKLNNWRLKFIDGSNKRTSKFYRIINELPSIVLLVILICAIVKPF